MSSIFLLHVIYQLFFQAFFITATLASPTDIWHVSIWEAPAPPPGKGPPLTDHALRDLSYLPAQIASIIGAYVLSVLVIGSGILFVGRRLRRAAQASPGTLSMEMMEPVKHDDSKAFDPSPISPSNNNLYGPSPNSTLDMKNNWPSPQSKSARNSDGWGSIAKGHRKQPSVVSSVVTFDESVIEDDKERNQKEMERLYAAVMEHDEKKSASVSYLPDEQRPQSPPELQHLRSTQKPSEPPPRSDTISPARTATKSPLASTKPTPLSMHSRNSSRSSFGSLSKKRGIRSLPISPPMGSPDLVPGYNARYGEAEPLTPRVYDDPGPPPLTPPQRKASQARDSVMDASRLSPRRTQFHEPSIASIRTPRTSIPAAPSIQTIPETVSRPEIQSRNSDRSKTKRTPAPLALRTQALVGSGLGSSSSAQHHPLRSAPLPLRNQHPASHNSDRPPSMIKATVLERKAPNVQSLRTPMTGVPMTPYSPYMPRTPLTPMTPSRLVTRAERKRREKEEGRKVATIDDAVEEEADILCTELHFGAHVAPASLPLPAPSFLCKSLLAKPTLFMMMPPHNDHGGKHNPRTRKSTAGQQYGKYPPLFDGAKFARNLEQARAKGSTRLGGVEALDFFLKDVPRDEVDMEREEQTPEPAECTGSGENEDDNIPGSEMVLDEPSTDLPMADASVLAEQGMVSSTQINKSNQSELKDSDECNTATEPTTNNTKGPTAHNTEGSITNKTKDSIANNTKDPIVHNTTDPTEEKELDFFSLVNHKAKPTASVEEAREHSASPKDNESSVEAPQERSITPDHNTDLAEDFDETPTGTDYEMDPVEELDETSDFEMTSVESLNTKKFDLKPFNYQCCPDKVRKQLLRCLLVSNRKINPYYNFGSIEVPAHKSCRENYTTMIVAFAGNKELLDEATTILYGENVFELQRAKVSLWWLQRIGPNISKLKHLKITVEEGLLDQFLTRLETLWSSIFYLLERKHKLQNLAVSFARWTLHVNNTDGLDPDKHSFVWEPRYEVLRSLLSFRGLNRVVVTPGPFVTEHFAEVLEEALILGPGQTNEEVVRLAEDIAPPKRTKYSFAYVKGST